MTRKALSLRTHLLLSALVVSLMVALVAAYAVYEQRSSVTALVMAEAADLASALAYHAPDDAHEAAQLAAYVRRTAALFGRDMVFLDTRKRGVADADPAQVGQVYRHDLNNEVALTLQDGRARYFTARSARFPSGVQQVVVAWRQRQAGDNGPIVGALIMEYTPKHTELEQVVRSESYLIIPLAVACIGVALLASLTVAARISQPISRLRDAAAAIAAGQFEARVERAGPQEVASLGQAFNGMATELMRYRDALTARGRDLEAAIGERTAELNHANDELRQRATELAKHNEEMTVLSRINEFLQASDNESEAYVVLSQTTAQLFPGDSGAFYVLSASRNVLDRVSQWGAVPAQAVEFAPSECWALRRGKAHLVVGSEPRCNHVGADTARYLCVPLLAHGETLGVLHIVDGSTGRPSGEEFRLARNLAESVSLAVANLRLRDAMRNLSMRDSLTGLYNRRYVEEALPQEFHRAKRQGSKVAVIMIDLDHFKGFNDRFGHDAGDAVLRELGQFLRRQVRESDVACRYGGEEFMMILGGTSLEGARVRAEELCAGAQRLEVVHDQVVLGPVTLSLGVAIFPDQGADPKSVIKAADTALYRAKRAGRDRVEVYAPPPPAPPSDAQTQPS